MSIAATIVSLLVSFNALSAGGPVLASGAPAPEITIDTWVKGDEVKTFDPDKVYLLEFWATWCGPCLSTIPHLTKIQAENPDKLVVIGVAASEKPDAPKDPAAPDAKAAEDPKAMAGKMLAKVKDFVAQQGDKMEYRVGFDADGSMGRDWMRAAKQTTIPCAFIVKGGKVAWLGNPKDMEGPLAKALGKEPPKKKKTTTKPIDGTDANAKTPAGKKAVD